MKPFVDLGTRNKGTFWEHIAAYSFLHTTLPRTAYTIPTFFGVGRGVKNKHCHHIKVIERATKLMKEEFLAGVYDKNFFVELDNIYRVPLQEVKALCSSPFFSYTNKELAKKIELIAHCMGTTHKPMLMALMSQHLLDFFNEELCAAILKNKKEESTLFDIMSLLLTPTKLTVAQCEEEYLIRLQKMFYRIYQEKTEANFRLFLERSAVQGIIKELAHTCGWFHMEYMQEPRKESDYISTLWGQIQAQKTKELQSPSEFISETRTKQEHFFEAHSTSKRLKDLAFVLREFSFILDASKATIIQENYLSRPLFTEAARRLGIPWQDLLYLTFQEIVYLLENNKKVDASTIEERKKCRVVYLNRGVIRVYQGEEAEKLADNFVTEEYTNSAEIKGIVGYPGVVRGKVTLVSSIQDEKRFNNGDVFVAHDGSAELTLFLKKASAIITDQGGMICHAAIIAREMKTPCIIGTTNATHLLKDGDIVEVDANKGIVRKLS